MNYGGAKVGVIGSMSNEGKRLRLCAAAPTINHQRYNHDESLPLPEGGPSLGFDKQPIVLGRASHMAFAARQKIPIRSHWSSRNP